MTAASQDTLSLSGVVALIQERLRAMPLVARLIGVLAALHPVYQLLVWLPFQWSRTTHERDVYVYYLTARNIAHRLPLYRPMPWVGPDINPAAYLYPPQFALLLQPLDHLNFHRFCLVWYCVIVLGFWVFAATLDALARGRATAMGTLYWGLGLAALPGAYEGMSEGQVDPVVWALFGLALATRHRGFFLAVLTQVKLFAAVPLAVAMWREGRRVTVPAAAALVAGCALGALAFGPRSFVDWVRWSLPLPGQGHFDPYNLSLSFLLLRMSLALGMWKYHHGPLPFLPHLFLQVCQIVGIVWALWATRKTPAPGNYVLALIAALLFSSTCWYTYAPLAFPLFALALRERRPASESAPSAPARA